MLVTQLFDCMLSSSSDRERMANFVLGLNRVLIGKDLRRSLRKTRVVIGDSGVESQRQSEGAKIEVLIMPKLDFGLRKKAKARNVLRPWPGLDAFLLSIWITILTNKTTYLSHLLFDLAS